MRVSVSSARDLECRVVDFVAAPDILRDGAKETAFREAALKAVNSLDRCAVLEFPLHATNQRIRFDLNISRSADGPGCAEVVAQPASNARPQ